MEKTVLFQTNHGIHLFLRMRERIQEILRLILKVLLRDIHPNIMNILGNTRSEHCYEERAIISWQAQATETRKPSKNNPETAKIQQNDLHPLSFIHLSIVIKMIRNDHSLNIFEVVGWDRAFVDNLHKFIQFLHFG